MYAFLKVKRQAVGALMLCYVAGCSIASAAPQPKEGAPLWLTEGLALCFSHIKDEDTGKAKADQINWKSIAPEYPAQLRMDMNYTKEIENVGYLVNYHIETFGSNSRKGCNIMKLPTRGNRVLPESIFSSLTESTDFEGEVVKFKACEQCLDDIAGHWSFNYLNQVWGMSALSGAANDVSFRITAIN